MVTLQELGGYDSNRILLIGPTDVGKTHGMVGHAVRCSRKGIKSIYCDIVEKSAVKELKNYTDADLANILYVPTEGFTDFKILARSFNKLDAEVLIVDATHYFLSRARNEVLNKFREKGEYRVNEDQKSVKIEDPDLFGLTYGMYQIPTRDIDETWANILKFKGDVIVSLDPTYPKVLEKMPVYGMFDFILQLSSSVTMETKTWAMQLKKFRGIEQKNYGFQAIPKGMDALDIFYALIREGI